MQIRFYQSGGIVGRMPKVPMVIQSELLSEEEAKEVSRLVDEAQKCPSDFSPTQVKPDAFYYRVEVEYEDGSTYAWEASDVEMAQELQPLISWLRRRNR